MTDRQTDRQSGRQGSGRRTVPVCFRCRCPMTSQGQANRLQHLPPSDYRCMSISALIAIHCSSIGPRLLQYSNAVSKHKHTVDVFIIPLLLWYRPTYFLIMKAIFINEFQVGKINEDFVQSSLSHLKNVQLVLQGSLYRPFMHCITKIYYCRFEI